MFQNLLRNSYLVFLLLFVVSGCRDNESSAVDTVSTGEATSISTKKTAETTTVEKPVVKKEPEAVPKEMTGVFLDASGIEGLRYTCENTESLSGKNGSFLCEKLPMDVYLGNLKLGTVTKLHSDHIVYTTDLLSRPRGATTYPEVSKISMILQTLDSDSDLSNGITISENIIQISDQYFYADSALKELSVEEINEILTNILKELADKNPSIILARVGEKEAQNNLTTTIATPRRR